MGKGSFEIHFKERATTIKSENKHKAVPEFGINKEQNKELVFCKE